MKIVVTGAAGFIGMHVVERLAQNGHEIVGLDNFNDYYDPNLKRARAQRIAHICEIAKLDIADAEAIKSFILAEQPDVVVHLAAQAGVRHSLENPSAYIQSNLVGHAAVLEACRALGDRLSHLVYASSSSVYGGNKEIPFKEDQRANTPVSLYAATKRSGELLSSAHAHLYNLKQIGLRFFTVYGPWGRPDMAYWIFAERILKGQPIRVFNNGDMRRDFTWVQDIVSGVVAAVEQTPIFTPGERPHRIYNIGNHKSVPLLDMIEILEDALGQRAIKSFEPLQPGDVKETYADISAFSADYGFAPTTSLEEGLDAFVAWYKNYHSI
ncbi:MAG: NAD-dependent epimerase/dehydratase family protein [Pseudomonadota bacterium]